MIAIVNSFLSCTRGGVGVLKISIIYFMLEFMQVKLKESFESLILTY